MPYDTVLNRRISNELKSIQKDYLNHIENNHMSPYLEYDSHYEGGMANRAPMSNDSYEEVEMKTKGSGISDTVKDIIKRMSSTAKSAKRIAKKEGTVPSLFKDIANVKSLGKLQKDGAGKKPRGRPKKQEGSGFFDDFARGFKSTFVPLASIAAKIAGASKPRGRPKKGGANLSSIVESSGKSFETPQEKLDKIVSQGGSKKKKVVISEPSKKNTINDILNSVGNGGVKEYKKGGSASSGRTVGGRKLLLKEEQPPSQMSGNGTSGGKKPNKWLEHVAKFRKTHPEFKGKNLIMEAKKTYSK